jgi:biogenesis of lysosome-related organelles complex 1 subunit 2
MQKDSAQRMKETEIVGGPEVVQAPSKSTTAVPAAEEERGQAEDAPEEQIVQASRRMFESIADFLRGELSLTSHKYTLLAAMNDRAASEYDKFGDYAEGLCVFIERLGQKSEILKEYLANVDEIDRQVTDLEAVVSALDGYTNFLEGRLRSASAPTTPTWGLGKGRLS